MDNEEYCNIESPHINKINSATQAVESISVCNYNQDDPNESICELNNEIIADSTYGESVVDCDNDTIITNNNYDTSINNGYIPDIFMIDDECVSCPTGQNRDPANPNNCLGSCSDLTEDPCPALTSQTDILYDFNTGATFSMEPTECCIPQIDTCANLLVDRPDPIGQGGQLSGSNIRELSRTCSREPICRGWFDHFGGYITIPGVYTYDTCESISPCVYEDPQGNSYTSGNSCDWRSGKGSGSTFDVNAEIPIFDNEIEQHEWIRYCCTDP